jgi:hypothetical protein
MNKQTDDDELDEFEKLEFARDLADMAEIMSKLRPEDFEKEFEELCAGMEFTDDDPDHEAFRRFLMQGARWARALKKYEQ